MKGRRNQIEFWFDFASTYSYPCAMQIESFALSAGVDVVWKPFLLGPIFKQQGWSDSPFNLYPAKGQYMWRDLERFCLKHDIPYKKPSQFPRNGLLAARVACVANDEPWLGEFCQRIFRANFVHDQDIASTDTVGRCLANLADNTDEVIEAAANEPAKTLLRHRTEQAQQQGIFGAPTFVCRDGNVYWGNERLNDALASAISE